MAVIAIASIKGGVGKTTVATNFAVMFATDQAKVLLVDADTQRNSAAFTALREDFATDGRPQYGCVELSKNSIRNQIRRMRHDYTHVLIDVGGGDSESLRSALTIADVVLIPCRPNTLDLLTTGQMLNTVIDASAYNENILACLFINQGPALGRDTEEANKMIDEMIQTVQTDNPTGPRIKRLEHHLGERKSFARATSRGLGIIEYRPSDEAAKEEIRQLFAEVLKHA